MPHHDGRGDFVLGNVHEQSLPDILDGPRARQLRQLVLSTSDSISLAIGKACPLKTIRHGLTDVPPPALRLLAIETTTACDRRCLSCPVRDVTGDTTCATRVATADRRSCGGMAFDA